MYEVIDAVISDAEGEELEGLKKIVGCNCRSIVSRDWSPSTFRVSRRSPP